MTVPVLYRASDFVAGMLYLTCGAAGLWFARTLTYGSAADMGPGYMPVGLCVGLILVGVVLCIRASLGKSKEVEYSSPLPFLIILAATVAFGLLLERLGALAALVVGLTLVSFAEKSFGGIERVLLIAVVTGATLLIFVVLLGQPIPVF